MFIFENYAITFFLITIIFFIIILLGAIKRRLFLTLMILFSILFILFSFFYQFYLTKVLLGYDSYKISYAINESVQCLVEDKYGLQKFYKNGSIALEKGTCSPFIFPPFLSVVNNNGFSSFIPYGNDPPILLSTINIHLSGSQSVYEKDYINSSWGENIRFYVKKSSLLNLIKQPGTVYFYIISTFFVFFICMLIYKYIILSFLYSHKTKIFFLLFISILPITICFSLWNLPSPYLHNYSDIKKSFTYNNLKEIRNQFLSSSYTKHFLKSSPSFLKRYGIKQVFVNSSPLLYGRYVRIKLDLFNYIYIFQDTKPQNFPISPDMSINRIADGVYIGKYDKYIKINNMTFFVCWTCWLAVVVIVFFSLWIGVRKAGLVGVCPL